MELIRGLHNCPPPGNGCVATIGNFDGMHPGHQQLCQQVHNEAQARGLPACLITFEPLPHEFFRPQQAPLRLQTLRDKVAQIAACGIDRLLILRFDAALAALSAEGFVSQVLHQPLGVQHLVIGDDFRFGNARQGDFSLLRRCGDELGFTVAAMDTIEAVGERVSSSRVRELLAAGNVAAAANLLARPYRISGRVVPGEQIGRQLGFPTANVALKRLRPPPRGVFAVTSTDSEGRIMNGVANLGERPTVGGRRLLLEVHHLDDDRDVYGEILHVDFLHRLRDEQRFASLDELKAAIHNDAEQARAFFRQRAESSSAVVAKPDDRPDAQASPDN